MFAGSIEQTELAKLKEIKETASGKTQTIWKILAAKVLEPDFVVKMR